MLTRLITYIIIIILIHDWLTKPCDLKDNSYDPICYLRNSNTEQIMYCISLILIGFSYIFCVLLIMYPVFILTL